MEYRGIWDGTSPQVREVVKQLSENGVRARYRRAFFSHSLRLFVHAEDLNRAEEVLLLAGRREVAGAVRYANTGERY